MEALNELCIKTISTEHSGGRKTKVSFVIEIDGIDRILWFALEDPWSKYLSADRCDAALVCIVYYAIRFGYNIRLKCPVSKLCIIICNIN